jgi:NADH:ubiquinone oxidoreductase subunit E
MTPCLIKNIVICMGSSCFSRGNNRNIEVIQDLFAGRPTPAALQLTGHLCEGKCRVGPNLQIDGIAYQGVDPVTLAGLVQQHLNPGRL